MNAETEKPAEPLLAPNQEIVRPLVTEKGMHRSTRNNQYAFEVALQAGAVPMTASIRSLCPAAIREMKAPNDCPVRTTRR